MRYLLSLILSINLLASMAQVTLEGNIFYGGEALEFATVVLYDSKQAIVDSEITSLEGSFSLDAPVGTYTLEISFIGLSTYESNIDLKENKKIDAIYMFDSSQELETVTIKARKRMIEQKPDRIVFNVSGNIAASGGNALDVMRLAPGLIVRRGGISMIGRGNSRIMLNGRLLQLSGEELNNFIAGLSADDIEKIEIIANPPAEYEAAGSGGLINIVLKKGALNSWRNSTSMAYNQSYYDYYSVNNGLFLNKNKLRLSLSLNADVGHIWENERLTINFIEQQWLMDMNSKSKAEKVGGKVLLDYDITDKWTSGVQYFGNVGRPDFTSLAVTRVNSATSDPYLLVNNSARNRALSSHALNVHNSYSIDSSGRAVSLDVDLFQYNNSFIQDIAVDRTTTGGAFIEKDLANENTSDQAITNLSSKLNFAHPTKLANFNYGLKFSTIRTQNGIVSKDLISGTPVLDPLLSNEFSYRESTAAAYISARKQVNDRLTINAGLRVENTTTEGMSLTLMQANKNQYTKLFPTFFASYVHSELSNFVLSYGRRINRPGFRDLNPFRIYVNDKAYSEGNPFLQPSFSDNFDFTHNYKGVFSTNIFFNYTTDGYGTVFSADPITQEQATIRRNYYTNYNMGVGERISLEPTSWWSSQNQIYLTQSISDFDETVDGVEQNGFQYYLSSNNSFQLSENAQAQVDVFYNSRQKGNIFEVGETYGVNLSLRKSFLDKSLKLGITANDILDSASYDELISIVNGVRSVYGQNYSSRNVRLTVNYTFGNKDISVNERSGSNLEERGRSN